jgi:hypothetical protein
MNGNKRRKLSVVWELALEPDYLENFERVLEMILENDLPALKDASFDEKAQISQDKGKARKLLDSRKLNSHSNGGLKE